MLRNRFARSAYHCCLQVGWDPRSTLRFAGALAPYMRDWFRFRRSFAGRMRFLPSLHDRGDFSGSVSEYFWQDLYVAREIFQRSPALHVDVGSRLDGFVAHVAAFREIEVLDIRPAQASIPGVKFKQADVMDASALEYDYCDSLSCLHALEHVGLGRYGDPLDPLGYEKGMRNLASILRRNGRMYLSVPIGRERVEFNSHRIFCPRSIVQLATANSMALDRFAWVEMGEGLREADEPDAIIEMLSKKDYSLGIFSFIKQ